MRSDTVLHRVAIPGLISECEVDLVENAKEKMDDLGFSELESIRKYAHMHAINKLSDSVSFCINRRLSKLAKLKLDAKGLPYECVLCEGIDRLLDYVSFSDLEWFVSLGRKFLEYGALSAAAMRAQQRRLKEYVTFKHGGPKEAFIEL